MGADMRKYLIAIALFGIGLVPARAADSTVAAMSAASALGGTELLYCVQGGADRKCTPAQVNTYVLSLMGTGVATALGVNVGSAGAPVLFNGAGGTPSSLVLTNATGLPLASVTGLGSGVATFLATPSSANLLAAVTDETGTGALVFGTSPTFTTGVTFGFLTGSTQCLHVNTSGVLSGTGADCGAGGGGVTSIAGNSGAFTLNATSGITNSTNDIVCTAGSSSQFGCVKVDNTTITAAAGVISSAPVTATPSTQTGTNYAFQGTDRAKVIYLSNGSNQVPTIAQAGTGSFITGWFTTACNIAAGTQTITPTTSTIGGAATYVLPAGSAAAPICISIISDGTNYVIVPDYFRFGANVATAAGLALSAAGGLSTTVVSGTSALGTSAISSATCATVVTTAATGTATTDVVWWGFNGDPTGVTGYAPLVAGMLTIVSYPSSGNVNFKVCNNTSGSITPGAITLNWRVIR